MHTLDSLVLLIGTLMVAVVGTYTIYWNLSVYRSLQERSMRSRTLWTTAAVFAVTIFIASAWLTATFHVDTVPVVITERIAITYIPINLFFGLATLVLFYVTGDRTLMAASKHDYQLKQPRGPERIVAKLRFLIWPLLSIFFAIPFLNVLLGHSMLEILAVLVLPILFFLFFAPIMIAGLLSARNRTLDPQLRAGMNLVVLTILVFLGFYLSAFINLQSVARIAGIFILPLMFYLIYRSSKSQIKTYKLPKSIK